VPYPDVARWISEIRVGVGRERQTSLRPGCSPCSPDSVSVRTSYVCLRFITFQSLEFGLPFLSSSFQSHLYECFYFSVFNFKINLNKNSVQCLQGINFSQLTPSEKP
jgi:hypothetical protein